MYSPPCQKHLKVYLTGWTCGQRGSLVIKQFCVLLGHEVGKIKMDLILHEVGKIKMDLILNLCQDLVKLWLVMSDGTAWSF